MAKETGFGAPDDLAAEPDIGFGSPDDLVAASTTGDTGFGSPSVVAGVQLVTNEAADDGGEILELSGDFSGYAGPYVVTLYGGPDGAEHTCYGAVQGQGYTCWPNYNDTLLSFVTPPLQTGTYSVRVEGYGGATEELADALVIVRRVWLSNVYSLRQKFPNPPLPVGPQDLGQEPILDASGNVAAVTDKIRAAFVKAVGEEETALSGVRMTRLTADLAPATTSLTVESTYGFPTAGIVYVEGLDTPKLTYTGRTATSLTGITRDPYETQTADRGGIVTDWSRAYSSLEEARADSLVHEADGTALTELAAEAYGVPRAGAWMSDATFREVVEAFAYAPAGGWRAVFDVTDAWTAQFRITGTTQVSGATILDPDGSTFRADHHGRWVRVTDADGTERLHLVKAVLPGVSLVLHSGAGTYWEASAYTNASRAWELLPFWFERSPGDIIVHVAITTGFAPPHYVQEHSDADYAAVVPPALTAGPVDLEHVIGAGGGTYSGYVLLDADAEQADIDPAEPFYVGGGGLDTLLYLLEDLVAYGVEVHTHAIPA